MTLSQGTLHVAADRDELARSVADFILARAQAAADGAIFALSGGSTPRSAYELLAQPPIRDALPWDRIHWVLGDERMVDARDPASNFGMVCDAFLTHVAAPGDHVHEVKTDLSPEAAAAAYEDVLRNLHGADALSPDRPLFELQLLGLGDDGHFASLIPGQPLVHEATKWVVAVPHGRSEPRVSLTLPAIASSRSIAILAQGAAKRDIVDAVLSGRAGEPSSLLHPHGKVHWFLDREAAGAHG